jgi:hypothetical protein
VLGRFFFPVADLRTIVSARQSRTRRPKNTRHRNVRVTRAADLHGVSDKQIEPRGVLTARSRRPWQTEALGCAHFLPGNFGCFAGISNHWHFRNSSTVRHWQRCTFFSASAHRPMGRDGGAFISGTLPIAMCYSTRQSSTIAWTHAIICTRRDSGRISPRDGAGAVCSWCSALAGQVTH